MNFKNLSPIHIIADIVQAIETFDEEKDKDLARATVATKTTNFKRNIKHTEKEKFILTTYNET